VTVDEFLAALITSLQSIAGSLANIAKTSPATRIALALPVITRNGKIMNFELTDDTVAAIPIHTVDDNGDVVPAPTGDVFTSVSSDPTKMTAMIGTMPSGPMKGAVALILTPMVKLASNLTATVTDTAALTMEMLTVDIVADLTPKAISLDTVDAVLTTQPVPAS
jgi:hypothetical protein